MDLSDNSFSQAEGTLIITSFKMESGLHTRDKAGVQDFVLLEDYTSEDAFIDNLKKRYDSDLIYVSQLKKINISAHQIFNSKI